MIIAHYTMKTMPNNLCDILKVFSTIKRLFHSNNRRQDSSVLCTRTKASFLVSKCSLNPRLSDAKRTEPGTVAIPILATPSYKRADHVNQRIVDGHSKSYNTQHIQVLTVNTCITKSCMMAECDFGLEALEWEYIV